jgi:hypothetical protein
VWTLTAANRPALRPWDLLQRFADHNNRTTEDVWDEFRLTPEQFANDPLAD